MTRGGMKYFDPGQTTKGEGMLRLVEIIYKQAYK